MLRPEPTTYLTLPSGYPQRNLKSIYKNLGTSLAVQWLRLCASNAGGAGSIPGRGTRIPHATWPKKTEPAILSNPVLPVLSNINEGTTIHLSNYLSLNLQIINGIPYSNIRLITNYHQLFHLLLSSLILSITTTTAIVQILPPY